MNKVSIIVPIYNAEKTLDKCLESIRTQTYKNIEILLVDDESKDSSVSICKNYCEKDNRFVLLSQKNAGPGIARNRGIDNATGQYLAFVDSDDYIEPNMIEIMLSTAIKQNTELVICAFYREKNNTQVEHLYKYNEGYYNGGEWEKMALDMIDDISPTRIPPYTWTRLIKRSLLENPKLRYSDNIYRSEDYLFLVQLNFRVKSMYLLAKDYLYHYIDNPSSITHSHVDGYWPMVKQIYTELSENLHCDKKIKQRINNMLIERSLIALHNACRNDNNLVFKEEVEEIINDELLERVMSETTLAEGLKVSKFYYLLMKFRLKFLIKLYFNYQKRSTKAYIS